MRGSVAAVGGVALAVVCCAAAPLLVGLVGGVAVATIGWGALLVALLGGAAILLPRRGRRPDQR